MAGLEAGLVVVVINIDAHYFIFSLQIFTVDIVSEQPQQQRRRRVRRRWRWSLAAPVVPIGGPWPEAALREARARSLDRLFANKQQAVFLFEHGPDRVTDRRAVFLPAKMYRFSVERGPRGSAS